MKKKPAKKRAAKQRGKLTVETIVRRRVQDRMPEVLRAAQKAVADRLEDAEEKAARLEEKYADLQLYAKKMERSWQDTVKLRDQAIERKEQQIKEQMAINQQLTSQVAEKSKALENLRDRVGFGFNEQFATPDGKTLCQVLESEISARKTSQEQLGVAMRDLRQCEAGQKKMAADRDLLANDLKAMGTRRDELQVELDQTRAAKAMWEHRADALAEELARYKKPPTADDPHRQVTEWTLTFADLAEFVRLFKPADGG